MKASLYSSGNEVLTRPHLLRYVPSELGKLVRECLDGIPHFAICEGHDGLGIIGRELHASLFHKPSQLCPPDHLLIRRQCIGMVLQYLDRLVHVRLPPHELHSPQSRGHPIKLASDQDRITWRDSLLNSQKIAPDPGPPGFRAIQINIGSRSSFRDDFPQTRERFQIPIGAPIQPQIHS